MSETEFGRFKREQFRLKTELLAIKYEIKVRNFLRALQVKFDPNQPRDEHGRWTDEMVIAGSASRDAECEAQYARDTFICNALKLRSCWESAAARYAACLRGHAIPALRF